MSAQAGLDLAALIEGDGRQHRYQGTWIHMDSINVLPQPRRTFDAIPELALDIAFKGMMNPVVVARFTRKDCAEYVAVINRLWQASFSEEQLVSIREEEEIFYVLLAGERRYRSCRLLWENGCLLCQEKFGEEEPGICFQRHFQNNGEIEVRLCVDISPLAALFLQLSENTHVPVPANEEAQAYSQLFKLIRGADSSFSIAKFARCVGRSPGTIRNALRFCELPLNIQEAVSKKEISYGIALELFRLGESGVLSEELDYWLLRAKATNISVSAFRELVNQHLDNNKSGQKSLFDIFDLEGEKLRRKMAIRHTVSKEVIQQLWGFLGYWLKVSRLCQDGQIPAVFSEESPVRLLRKNIDVLSQQILPQLEEFLPKKMSKDIGDILKSAEDTLEGVNSAASR